MKTSQIIIGLAVALFLTSACAMPAHAIGIFGQWQDSKDADSGYGLGIKQGYSIIPLVMIEGRVSWLNYSIADTDSDMNVYPLEVFAALKFGMFYGGLGIGYYIMSGDYTPDDAVGGFASLGLDFSLAGLGLFGEVRYLLLESEVEATGGTGDMTGVGANLGVTLPF